MINLLLSNVDAPPPRYVLYNDIVLTVFLMRDVSVIQDEWLNELVPDYFDFGTRRQIESQRFKSN